MQGIMLRIATCDVCLKEKKQATHTKYIFPIPPNRNGPSNRVYQFQMHFNAFECISIWLSCIVCLTKCCAFPCILYASQTFLIFPELSLGL